MEGMADRKFRGWAAALAWGVLAFPFSASAVLPSDFILGAGLSSAKNQEAWTSFKDVDGKDKPVLQIFRDHGYGWIRLDLFHTPANGPYKLPNDLAYTAAYASEAKRMGYKFLLDYHLSDTWANPGAQALPMAWKDLTLPALEDSLYRYTRATIAALREAGAMPDMVQIGNEITCGMLWPFGNLCGMAGGSWGDFAALFASARRGIDEGRGNMPMPRIMLHIDKGGLKDATQRFFDQVAVNRIPFDVIGQSFYPRWDHGTFSTLKENLAFMAGRYGKEIVIVETMFGYDDNDPGKPWYSARNGDIIPYTDEGQVRYFEELGDLIAAAPDGLGKGFFLYDPTHPQFQVWPFWDTTGAMLPKPVMSLFDAPTGIGPSGSNPDASGPRSGKPRRFMPVRLFGDRGLTGRRMRSGG
jgi:arabinogalactan endo-1,4-beta-galactosidase